MYVMAISRAIRQERAPGRVLAFFRELFFVLS